MHSKGVIFKLRFQFAESGRWEQKRKKKSVFLKTITGEFPSSPVVKPWCFHCWVLGSIPAWVVARYAEWPKRQNKQNTTKAQQNTITKGNLFWFSRMGTNVKDNKLTSARKPGSLTLPCKAYIRGLVFSAKLIYGWKKNSSHLLPQNFWGAGFMGFFPHTQSTCGRVKSWEDIEKYMCHM